MPEQRHLYIEIKQPITLNKFKDGAAPRRRPNEMQELKNYICKQGEIYVRKGITTFSFA